MTKMRILNVISGGLYVIIESWDTYRDGCVDVRSQRTYVETAEAVLNAPKYRAAWSAFLAKYQ